MKAASNSTAANDNDKKRRKWGRGGKGEGGTEDIAKPGYSTGVANRTKTLRLVVRAEQTGFAGLLE